MITTRKTTYLEALESSWPHGRFLVQLIEGVSRAKTETPELMALRMAKERLDEDIISLASKRSLIQEEISKTCLHPIDAIFVEENEIDAVKQFIVYCKLCSRELIRHSRDLT